jgi:hypothetical protein
MATPQSVPGPTISPTAPLTAWTPAQWITAWQAKTDAQGGTVDTGFLIAPTVTGGTLSGTFAGTPTWSGAHTFSAAGTALAVTHNVSIGGTLILEGATSGAITLQSPAVAGSHTMTLAPGAVSSQTPAIPTAPASLAVFTMQGLAGAFTPASSGKVIIIVTGTVICPSATAAGDGIKWQLCYGTGTAPANAAAVTGTAVGVFQSYTNANTVLAGDVATPFTAVGVVTGLTVGTAYWFDLAAESIGAASSVGIYHITAMSFEIL